MVSETGGPVRETREQRQTTDPQRLRQHLLNRRELLLAAAGTGLALLLGTPKRANSDADTSAWSIIETVQQHLLPDEAHAPGAKAIYALPYLQQQFPHLAVEQREFLLNGVDWLEDLAQQQTRQSFLELQQPAQDQLLRQIGQSRAGENWLATLLTFLFEAMLTAPAYGGNPGGVGWRWLEYAPGFPLPDADTLYWKLAI